jgi:fatty acid desaturase
MRALNRVEWPTVVLLAACYGLWGMGVFVLPAVSLGLAVAVTAWAVAQHSSLCHEAIHGHPTRSPAVNAALVFPALVLVIPFGRFRDTHLAHHQDADLTDPYDDPESNYLARRDWEGLPAALRLLLRANNTLAGRLVLGPVLGVATWVADDLRAAWQGNRAVIAAWLWHVPAVSLVLLCVLASPMPLWAYGLAAYLALSLLKIRTFLEHQAHERARGRTAIVEDRGPLALLFLNNNLHVVHHMHPRVPWYRLPQLYRANRERYLGVNGGYRYRSYGEIVRRYLWTPKDPVVHPLMRRD